MAEGPKHGPPLWLFHGLGRRWQDFTPLLADLSLGYHALACDHRGHGRSERSDSYLLPDYIADAAALVRTALEPAVLVGHSLGAVVSLGVAAKVPTMVRAIVLLDPPGTRFLAGIESTSYAAMWRGMQRLAGTKSIADIAGELADLRLPLTKPGDSFRLGDVRDAASLRFMAQCLRDLDPRTMTPPLEHRWLNGFDMLETARSVRCPVLLVVADPNRGGMLPPVDAQPLVAAFRDCTRVDLTGIGHLLHWQDTQATLRVLNAFLISLN